MKLRVVKMKKASRDREFSSIVIILNQKKQVLLLKRLNNPKIAFPNCWGLPGGGADEGERPQDAAIREIHEETGLVIDKKHLKYVDKTITNNKDVFVFACSKYKGELQPEKVFEEHDDWSWFSLKELTSIKTPPKTDFYFKKAISILHGSTNIHEN